MHLLPPHWPCEAFDHKENKAQRGEVMGLRSHSSEAVMVKTEPVPMLSVNCET